MTEVDPSDKNFLDGKLYKVDVEITETGSYNYRFSFTDWKGEEAYGTATLTRTLTVN
jgi:hypothetical protein